MDFLRKHIGQQGTGLSYELWKNFPTHEIFTLKDRSVGYGFYDDFEAPPHAIAATSAAPEANVGPWLTFTSATSTIAATHVAAQYGICSLIPTTTVDLVSSIQHGQGVGAPFSLAVTAPRELIMEFRFSVSSIADHDTTIFIGLAQAGIQAAVDTLFTTGTHVPKGVQYFGFARMAGSQAADGVAATGYHLPTKLYGIHSLSALNWHSQGCKTLVADTFTKIGFRLNPNNKTVSIWVDGVEKTAFKITAAITASATAWPTAALAPCAIAKNGASFTGQLNLDWMACGQLAS